MKIRAKFKCGSVTIYEGGTEEVNLSAVLGGSDENKTWSTYTPSGSVKMLISAKGAVGQFVAGREYYVGITEASGYAPLHGLGGHPPGPTGPQG